MRGVGNTHLIAAIVWFFWLSTPPAPRDAPLRRATSRPAYDQAGVERYIRSFYSRLSPTWRKRLSVVGIHNYSDVNRNRSRGTARIINAVRHYNRSAKFWFTETGALASFGRSFRYSESRQAARIKNVFTYASRYRTRGVQRVYVYNVYGLERGDCGSRCRFDAGLLQADGTPRRVFGVFAQRLRSYSR